MGAGLVFLLMAAAAVGIGDVPAVGISDAGLAVMGGRVFQNECSGRVECLVSWNAGEDFMSLGIGHFIWYPSGRPGPFEESFPALVAFLRARGDAVPDWLGAPPVCPWPDRETFLKDKADSDPRVQALRDWLIASQAGQAAFLGERLRQALPAILEAAEPGDQPYLQAQFSRLAQTPEGLFALVDYVNFKGKGTSPTERYQGQGWGLLQVLERMTGEAPGPEALREFSAAAEQLLTERVLHAPPERGEERWLAGWKNRVAGYRPVEEVPVPGPEEWMR